MSAHSLFHIVKQEKAPEVLKVIVEIPKGDFVKYEYNHKYNVLEVDRVLYGPAVYPAVYADVPNTWNIGDGDPLDAVVYTTGNVYPGVLMTVRVIGMMEMVDNGETDNKIICVNARDPRYDNVKELSDLPPYKLKDLQTFMETYKHAQTGPGTVKIPGFKSKEEAYKEILSAMAEYQRQFGNIQQQQ